MTFGPVATGTGRYRVLRRLGQFVTEPQSQPLAYWVPGFALQMSFKEDMLFEPHGHIKPFWIRVPCPNKCFQSILARGLAPTTSNY